MGISWTQQEIDVLLKSLHLPTAEIWDNFRSNRQWENVRTYDSVQKKIKALKEVHLEQEETTPAFQVPPELTQNSELLFVPTATVRTEIEQWITEAAERLVPNRVDPTISNAGHSLVLLLSDNHFGKLTTDFNLVEAKKRILSITEKLVETGFRTELLDEIVVVLAGDMVEGEDIYSNQNGTLECPVIYQAKAAAEAIWQLLLDLRSTFDCSVRVETCPGNHGRMSRTASSKSNWDNVVYLMIASLAEQNPELHIGVNLTLDEFAVFAVKDKTLMAYHHGTPHLGTPSTQGRFMGWTINYNVDLIMHGHWHRWGIETCQGKVMVSNGCLCGPDDLAKRMAKEEPARQGYFLVENGKPIRTFGYVEWQS